MPETAHPSRPAALERRSIDTGEVVISVLAEAADAGAAAGAAPDARPVVVFLHGLAGSAAEFLPTAEAIGPGYRSVLVELRGHGHSTRHPGDASREAYVRDVIAVIEQFSGAGGVALVGHSMGAHTAMLAASARPDLVRMLVMVEGGVHGSPPEAAQRIGGYFASWPAPFPNAEAASAFLGDSAVARAWSAGLEQRSDGLHPRFDAAFLQASIAAVHAQPRWEEWEALPVPTAAVFAAEGMFDEAGRAALVQARPATLRVDLSSGSHDAHLDAAEEWSAVLGDLLSRLGDGQVRWDW